jgi:hypothetical protein
MEREINLESSEISVGKIERLSWLLTGIMTIASLVCFNLEIAKAVLIGGIIANTSFMFMKRDLVKAMRGILGAVKVTFLLKYYARLTALALILFALIKYGQLSTSGMLLGLSSVVFSIGFTAINQLRRDSLSKKNIDGAIVETS